MNATKSGFVVTGRKETVHSNLVRHDRRVTDREQGAGKSMSNEDVAAILTSAYFSDSYSEAPLLKHLAEILENVRTFVDVGASIGVYTYHVSRYLQGATIVAVEPDPTRYEHLEANCRLWADSSGNKIIPFNVALSQSQGQRRFYVPIGRVASGGLFPHHVRAPVQGWKELDVVCMTLDDLMGEKVPELVKIDVEGSELQVLHGAKRILAIGRTAFLVELHEGEGWTDPELHAPEGEVIRFMASHGYVDTNFHGRSLFTPPAPPAH